MRNIYFVLLLSILASCVSFEAPSVEYDNRRKFSSTINDQWIINYSAPDSDNNIYDCDEVKKEKYIPFYSHQICHVALGYAPRAYGHIINFRILYNDKKPIGNGLSISANNRIWKFTSGRNSMDFPYAFATTEIAPGSEIIVQALTLRKIDSAILENLVKEGIQLIHINRL